MTDSQQLRIPGDAETFHDHAGLIFRRVGVKVGLSPQGAGGGLGERIRKQGADGNIGTQGRLEKIT